MNKTQQELYDKTRYILQNPFHVTNEFGTDYIKIENFDYILTTQLEDLINEGFGVIVKDKGVMIHVVFEN